MNEVTKGTDLIDESKIQIFTGTLRPIKGVTESMKGLARYAHKKDGINDWLVIELDVDSDYLEDSVTKVRSLFLANGTSNGDKMGNRIAKDLATETPSIVDADTGAFKKKVRGRFAELGYGYWADGSPKEYGVRWKNATGEWQDGGKRRSEMTFLFPDESVTNAQTKLQSRIERELAKGDASRYTIVERAVAGNEADVPS